MDVLAALKERISADKFDPSRRLSEAEIQELVAYATEAPSSFNIQHWRFVAVTDPADKERLKALAYNQQKVADAAVVFIVLGDLRGYEKLPEIVQRAVAAGLLSPEGAESWVNMAQATYANNPTLARDEAIRSGALAAMALMLAAQAKGLASGPMIGFDPEGVKREFGIADRYVPVMLLAVGYPALGNLPRKPRLGVDEVLAFGRGREF
jgi:nitroreductase